MEGRLLGVRRWITAALLVCLSPLVPLAAFVPHLSPQAAMACCRRAGPCCCRRTAQQGPAWNAARTCGCAQSAAPAQAGGVLPAGISAGPVSRVAAASVSAPLVAPRCAAWFAFLYQRPPPPVS